MRAAAAALARARHTYTHLILLLLLLLRLPPLFRTSTKHAADLYLAGNLEGRRPGIPIAAIGNEGVVL